MSTTKKVSFEEGKKHVEKKRADKRKKKHDMEERVTKDAWGYRTSSTMAPLSDEGRDNYKKIFGHD